jgi:hypothetical protein
MPLPPPAGNNPALLLRQSTYQLLRELERRDWIPDPTDFNVTKRDGKTFFKINWPIVNYGSFFRQIPDAGGDVYLQGGTVNGVAVATSELLLYIADPGTWQGAAGDHLILEVEGEGVVEDGLLLAGFDVTTITVSIGPPSAHILPTADDPTGTAYISLGEFSADSFYPAMKGNINIAFCPGNFTITRETPTLAEP